MDVDFKPPHQENGAKKDEDIVQKEKAPPDVETNGTTKESPKHSTRPKRGQHRSRSRTPQKKSDEAKTLQVSLQKINTELNGKDLIEETAVEMEDAKAADGAVKKDVSLNNSADKIDEGTTKHVRQSKKQKEEEKSKQKEETEKEGNQEKEAVKIKSPRKEKKDKTKRPETSQTDESDPVEMDPLIISDEPDPELEFDENEEDLESGTGSPVISRCITRRSQTRNIPTPKTPKSVDQDLESEKTSTAPTPTELIETDADLPKTDNLYDSRDSLDTASLSTRVEVGSDVTRLDYIDSHNSNLTEDTSYLNASRERSLGETLRGLSARRPIRPVDDYRRRALRINQEKSDLNMPYSSLHSVDQITTGMKRKNRSITPEERKKFKTDSSGLNSIFSSPLANLRNKFRSDLPSSTPKLLGYRDTGSELHYNDEQNMIQNGDDEKKSWCSVM